VIRGRGTDRLLRELPLFHRVADAELSRLAVSSHSHQLSRGEVLFRQGDAASAFYVVVDGTVKLSVLSEDGTEKVIEVIQPGESFGEAMVLLGQPFPVTASVLVSARLVAVPAEALEALLDADPMFARQMLAGLAVRLHGMVRDIEAYALRSGRQRVVSYLVERTQPGSGGPGARVVQLSASKQTIASRLNLAPETLSRVLRELGDDGLITVDGRRITIPDLPALARRAQPDSLR
jgi:CRP/FNR family transcriptional regulator, dissimilatory nitrate respiration regulator